MSVTGIGAPGGGGAQALGGSMLERAQQLIAEAPGQAEAFRATLDSAHPEATAASAEAAASADTSRPGASQSKGVLGVTVQTAPSSAENLLRQVETGHHRLTEILGELDSGQAFSAHQMLGLQAEMHQIMRQLETATKVMGEVVSGAKTLMQQQV